MKNKLNYLLKQRKNLRGQMLWAILRSFLLALLTLILMSFILPPAQYTLTTFALAFVFFFILFTRPMIHYIRTIASGIMLIAKGDLSMRLPLLREDELGAVAQNINHMAEQLQAQMERERELEKSKMELITYVSHDLRTPLTSIIGYLDLLKNYPSQNESERERYINNAYHKTQQLKKLIDDLFEYTRLSDTGIRLSSSFVDINSLLEQMVSEFEPVANEQNMSIRKRLPDHPVMLAIDSEKIVRALDNLLMNALKFSIKPGEIIISLQVQDHVVTLTIENTGMPISKEQEKRLFERFYKLEPSRHDHHLPAGFGLGLSITQHIIELHQGRIWLEQNEGRYRFNIELPFHEDSSM